MALACRARSCDPGSTAMLAGTSYCSCGAQDASALEASRPAISGRSRAAVRSVVIALITHAFPQAATILMQRLADCACHDMLNIGLIITAPACPRACPPSPRCRSDPRWRAPLRPGARPLPDRRAMAAIASASAAASSTGTSRPSIPSRISRRGPALAAASTGVPTAIASTSTLPNPSRREASTNRSAAAIGAARSGTWPRSRTRSPRQCAAIRSRSARSPSPSP